MRGSGSRTTGLLQRKRANRRVRFIRAMNVSTCIYLSCLALLWRALLSCPVLISRHSRTCRLSAYLYEATNDSKYLDAAEQTGSFILRHLYNGTIILDSIDIKTCSQDNSLRLTYNTGYYVEALAVLANITSNATWSNVCVLSRILSAQYG